MKRTSTEAHVYMRRHQGAKVEHFDVFNLIYHKFLHGAVSYTLHGENVNVMLEWCISDINVCNFNERLTNDVVSFEQPGPGLSCDHKSKRNSKQKFSAT